jgi:hypothetical protein
MATPSNIPIGNKIVNFSSNYFCLVTTGLAGAVASGAAWPVRTRGRPGI